MKKIIGIIAGEPNSIASEIIFKTWANKRKFKNILFLVIGSYNLINLQKKKLKFKLKINKLLKDFTLKEITKDKNYVLNMDYNQKKPFQRISNKSNKYIFNCFELALQLIKEKKLYGLINCPISKETLLKNRFLGITEYLEKKVINKNKTTMLIFNKKFSVSPITTHIPLKNVSKNLKKINIINKIKLINEFYLKHFNLKPKIGVLGLNPHNNSNDFFSEERKIIVPAIKHLKKNKIDVIGPIPTDTSFLIKNKMNLNVLVGMYHDQVLTSFKYIYGFESINITLGLPFIRISPDHGIAKDITGKLKADPRSLIEALKFFNSLKVKKRNE